MTKLLTDRVKLIRCLQQHPLMDLKTISKIRQDTSRFLSLSQEVPGMVSFANHPANVFNNEKRCRTTISRFLHRQMGLAIEDPEDLHNYVISNTLDVCGLEVTMLSGTEIIEAFQDEVGGDSCMTGENAEYTTLYAINPDKVSLAVLRLSSDIAARALVWVGDSGRKYMSRIYSDSLAAMELLAKWAKSQDILTSVPPGETVTITNIPRVFPYIDLFHLGTFKSGQLILSTRNGPVFFDSTNGSYSADVCADCDAYIIDEFSNFCEECRDDHRTEE